MARLCDEQTRARDSSSFARASSPLSELASYFRGGRSRGELRVDLAYIKLRVIGMSGDQVFYTPTPIRGIMEVFVFLPTSFYFYLRVRSVRSTERC